MTGARSAPLRQSLRSRRDNPAATRRFARVGMGPCATNACASPRSPQYGDIRTAREGSMQFGMGQAVVRKEDLRLLTGRGRYLDDINLPEQAHAAILRSPHAHARIRSVDTALARQSPGVIAVFTGADIEADGVAPLPCLAHVPNKPGTPEQAFPRRMVLVADRVLHVGDAVALVVAESAAAARDALAEIAVD